jgi:hypothetical protein
MSSPKIGLRAERVGIDRAVYWQAGSMRRPVGAELQLFCSIEINSTSKIKVALGPMSPPALLSP